MISKRQFINEVADSIKIGKGSLFVGAGVDMDAGYPSWKELLSDAAKKLDLQVNEDTNLFQLAQYYENLYTRNKLLELLDDKLEGTQFKSPLVNSMLSLPVNSIWTTNFDKVIEKNIDRQNKLYNLVYTEKHLPKLSNNKMNIFKINGDIHDRESIIITTGDIEKHISEREMMFSLLKKELISNTFLFVGYSFSDSLILNCMHNIKMCLEDFTPCHYSVMKRDRTNPIHQEYFINDLDKRYNIKVYLVEENKDIPELIQEIKRKVIEKNVLISGSLEYATADELSYCYDLCSNIGRLLIDKHFNVHTGFGRNIGHYIAGETLQYLNEKGIGDDPLRLKIKPFALQNNDSQKNRFREQLIDDANIVIFLYGQCIHPETGAIVNSAGTLKEFEIANHMNKYIIPIGSTNYASREIFTQIKANINKYPYLEQYLTILENESDISKIMDAIWAILNTIT